MGGAHEKCFVSFYKQVPHQVTNNINYNYLELNINNNI